MGHGFKSFFLFLVSPLGMPVIDSGMATLRRGSLPVAKPMPPIRRTSSITGQMPALTIRSPDATDSMDDLTPEVETAPHLPNSDPQQCPNGMQALHEPETPDSDAKTPTQENANFSHMKDVDSDEDLPLPPPPEELLPSDRVLRDTRELSKEHERSCANMESGVDTTSIRPVRSASVIESSISNPREMERKPVKRAGSIVASHAGIMNTLEAKLTGKGAPSPQAAGQGSHYAVPSTSPGHTMLPQGAVPLPGVANSKSPVSLPSKQSVTANPQNGTPPSPSDTEVHSGNVLQQIRRGVRLRRTLTNDRSAPRTK